MMNIKSIVLAAAVMFGGMAMAQDAEHRGDKKKGEYADRAEKMIAELGLDEAQAAKYRALEKENREKIREVRQNEREGKHEKMRQLRDEHQTKLKEILTDEQWAKLEAQREEKRQKAIKRTEKMKEKQAPQPETP